MGAKPIEEHHPPLGIEQDRRGFAQSAESTIPLVLGVIPQIAAREISKRFEDARADVVAVASRLPRITHSRVRK